MVESDPSYVFQGLPLELVGQILEFAVRSHRDTNMQWAAALRLVSRATQTHLLAPLFYVFVVRWPVMEERHSASYKMLLDLVRMPATTVRAHIRHIVLISSLTNDLEPPPLFASPVEWHVDSICLLPNQTPKDVAYFSVFARCVQFTSPGSVPRALRVIQPTRISRLELPRAGLPKTELGLMLQTRTRSRTPSAVLVGGILPSRLVRAIESLLNTSTEVKYDLVYLHLHIKLESAAHVTPVVTVIAAFLRIAEIRIVLHVGHPNLPTDQERGHRAAALCAALKRHTSNIAGGNLAALSERVSVQSTALMYEPSSDGTSYALLMRAGMNLWDAGVSLDEYLAA